jgi:hypothetical protein
MTQLTVGEIAKRIKEPDEPISGVINRLRSWTKEGVLKPLGDEAPGTGQKLRYPERAIVDAAILSRLARHYGIWATKVPLFAGALDLAVKQLPKARAAAELDPAKVIYLIVGTTGQGKNLRVQSNIQYVDDAWRSRRPKDGLPKRSIKLSPFMSDGLFIDLTSLFERLGVPLAEAEALKKLAKEYPGIERIQRG